MKSIKNLSVFFTLTLLVAALVACGNQNNEDSQNNDGSNGLSGSIIVGGSSALQPLAAAGADKFMEKNPNVQINVQGGGSGTGLSEVDSGNFDIGNSDYFAESKEGIDAESLVDHKVAVVGMTAAVNPEVGVDNLSKDDLKKIWTGEIKNWKEVGGEDLEITTVNRPDGSGTRATFVQFGLDGEKPKSDITEDSSNRVKNIVAETPGAIGYLAFSYFNDDSVVKMSIDGVEATDKNVQSGDFPIWAYEHMYTKGEPEGVEKAFLDYMMSDEIQSNLVPAQGYIASTKMEVERDAEGNQSEK